MLVGRTHLVLVHGGHPVVLAVEAVEVEGNAANLVLSFTHVLVVGGLDSDDVLAVSFLEVQDGHDVHFANMAVEVGDDVVGADALVDGDHGDRDEERVDQAGLAVSDVGCLDVLAT